MNERVNSMTQGPIQIGILESVEFGLGNAGLWIEISVQNIARAAGQIYNFMGSVWNTVQSNTQSTSSSFPECHQDNVLGHGIYIVQEGCLSILHLLHNQLLEFAYNIAPKL